ncbi:MAG: hypothetical protein ACRC2H_01130 [Silanimonas sp.]
MKKSLTPAQQAVINGMAAGWELGRNSGFAPLEWLQLGGIGMGGPSKGVRAGTAMRLTEKGFIRATKSDYPLTKYALTDAGRAAAKENDDG